MGVILSWQKSIFLKASLKLAVSLSIHPRTTPDITKFWLIITSFLHKHWFGEEKKHFSETPSKVKIKDSDGSVWTEDVKLFDDVTPFSTLVTL